MPPFLRALSYKAIKSPRFAELRTSLKRRTFYSNRSATADQSPDFCIAREHWHIASFTSTTITQRAGLPVPENCSSNSGCVLRYALPRTRTISLSPGRRKISAMRGVGHDITQTVVAAVGAAIRNQQGLFIQHFYKPACISLGRSVQPIRPAGGQHHERRLLDEVAKTFMEVAGLLARESSRRAIDAFQLRKSNNAVSVVHENFPIF